MLLHYALVEAKIGNVKIIISAVNILFLVQSEVIVAYNEFNCFLGKLNEIFYPLTFPRLLSTNINAQFNYCCLNNTLWEHW